MKITKEQIQKIIAEELQKEILAERMFGDEGPLDQAAHLTGLKGPDQKVDAARHAISPFGDQALRPVANARKALSAASSDIVDPGMKSALKRISSALGMIEQMMNQEIEDPAQRATYVSNSARQAQRNLAWASESLAKAANVEIGGPSAGE
jgi:hypothetical protein